MVITLNFAHRFSMSSYLEASERALSSRSLFVRLHRGASPMSLLKRTMRGWSIAPLFVARSRSLIVFIAPSPLFLAHSCWLLRILSPSRSGDREASLRRTDRRPFEPPECNSCPCWIPHIRKNHSVEHGVEPKEINRWSTRLEDLICRLDNRYVLIVTLTCHD